MEQMLTGAIAVGSLVAGLFFFRFWRHTRDRFFLWFAPLLAKAECIGEALRAAVDA